MPDDLRAEYVDGAVVVNPPPTFGHQRVCLRLHAQLSAALPEAVVTVGAGWKLRPDRDDVRIPDVAVLASEPFGALVTEAPVVVVEVLSTNRADDLVRKATAYLDAGAGQYWIVDPRDRVLDAYLNTEGGWQVLARLTDDAPTGEVSVAAFGSVPLDLVGLLGPPTD